HALPIYIANTVFSEAQHLAAEQAAPLHRNLLSVAGENGLLLLPEAAAPGGQEVEFAVLLVPALEQKGITRRGDRKSSASLDRQFKHSVLFEIRPHQPEFIVVIEPQVFFFIQADGVAVVDGILFILPEWSSLRCPCNQAASAQRFIPTVITKYTFVKVAGNDSAIFFYHTVLNAIPQAETGQHSSVPADDPGVLVGAVFPIGASCPQQEE